MARTKHFGDIQWDKYEPYPGAGWPMPSNPGRSISVDDPYWGHVLDNARKAYGDPNIHFDTDRPTNDSGLPQPRHLVFGDGTALPSDGTVVYHDSATKQNWAQNDDGTASLVGPDGRLGPPLTPSGYRKVDDQYAPVNDIGQQIAPQLGGVPSSNNGFFTDPKTGVLTPKNANGDYYTLGPDGKKSFFDKSGDPITENQFSNAKDQRTRGAPDAGLSTDEQQSGNAADAVRKLQDELRQRFTTITDAEEKLSEVLLNAHATTAEGQAKLNDIQKKIVDAVNNPAMDTKTAAGEKAYLTFLRSQVSAIQELLSSSSLRAEDQSKAASALAALYSADNGDTPSTSNDPGTTDVPTPAPASAAPEQADPGLSADPSLFDPGLGPAPAMPDPSLSDLMGTPMSPFGADPMASLASMLPGALGSLGGLGAGGSPLDGLGGLAGAASPLAGLASGVGDHNGHDGPSDITAKPDEKTDPVNDKGATDKTDTAKNNDTTAPLANQQQNNGQPGQPGQDPQNGQQPGQPPPPVAPPVAASPTVQLPDGSTADARTPQAAQAVRDWLKGGTVDTSYRQNGMTLPPVGTPVTDGVPPTQLHCGDVAMFKDHYEPVLSSVKGYHNGNVVPLGQVTSSPNFLGFIDPTAGASAGAAGHSTPLPLPASAVPASPVATSAEPATAGAPVPAG